MSPESFIPPSRRPPKSQDLARSIWRDAATAPVLKDTVAETDAFHAPALRASCVDEDAVSLVLGEPSDRLVEAVCRELVAHVEVIVVCDPRALGYSLHMAQDGSVDGYLLYKDQRKIDVKHGVLSVFLHWSSIRRMMPAHDAFHEHERFASFVGLLGVLGERCVNRVNPKSLIGGADLTRVARMGNLARSQRIASSDEAGDVGLQPMGHEARVLVAADAAYDMDSGQRLSGAQYDRLRRAVNDCGIVFGVLRIMSSPGWPDMILEVNPWPHSSQLGPCLREATTSLVNFLVKPS